MLKFYEDFENSRERFFWSTIIAGYKKEIAPIVKSLQKAAYDKTGHCNPKTNLCPFFEAKPILVDDRVYGIEVDRFAKTWRVVSESDININLDLGYLVEIKYYNYGERI